MEQPPRTRPNLAGRWHVNSSGETLRLRHWQLLDIVYSVRDCNGEELYGHLAWDGGVWKIHAHFGMAGVSVGVVNQLPSLGISWSDGSAWTLQQALPATSARSASLCKSIVLPCKACGAKIDTKIDTYFTNSGHLVKRWCRLTCVYILAYLAGKFLRLCIKSLNHQFALTDATLQVVAIFLFLMNFVIFAHLGTKRNRPRLHRLAAWIFATVSVVFMIQDLLVLYLIKHEQLLTWICATAMVAAVLGVACHVLLYKRHYAQVEAEDPLSWHGVRQAQGEDRAQVIYRFEQAQSPYADTTLYVTDVYEIDDEDRTRSFQQYQEEQKQKDDMLNAAASECFIPSRELYHGAPCPSIKSICTHGFRLPWRCARLMFGAGLYFTDVPQKAWTFGDKKYLLVCDVALGRTKTMMDAAPGLSYDHLREPSLRRGSVYDSVLGEDDEHGGVLRNREYVVYKTQQVLVRYVLAVSESPPV